MFDVLPRGSPSISLRAGCFGSNEKSRAQLAPTNYPLATVLLIADR